MKFKKIEVPFPIGVEYFRSGVPKREVWEKDFFEIKRRGFNIVRTASYWNWMEPSKGQYKLDDIDAFFDLANKSSGSSTKSYISDAGTFTEYKLRFEAATTVSRCSGSK